MKLQENSTKYLNNMTFTWSSLNTFENHLMSVLYTSVTKHGPPSVCWCATTRQCQAISRQSGLLSQIAPLAIKDSKYVFTHQTSLLEMADKILQHLTHWGRDKCRHSQMTFSNAFSWLKMCEFHLGFHWGLFLMLELTIFLHWFR